MVIQAKTANRVSHISDRPTDALLIRCDTIRTFGRRCVVYSHRCSFSKDSETPE